MHLSCAAGARGHTSQPSTRLSSRCRPASASGDSRSPAVPPCSGAELDADALVALRSSSCASVPPDAPASSSCPRSSWQNTGDLSEPPAQPDEPAWRSPAPAAALHACAGRGSAGVHHSDPHCGRGGHRVLLQRIVLGSRNRLAAEPQQPSTTAVMKDVVTAATTVKMVVMELRRLRHAHACSATSAGRLHAQQVAMSSKCGTMVHHAVQHLLMCTAMGGIVAEVMTY